MLHLQFQNGHQFQWLCFVIHLNVRCDQYSSRSIGDVFWRSADEEVEAEHHGCSKVCLWHISDWLHTVTVLLCNEL